MADPAEKVQENVDLDASVQQEVNEAAEQPEVESNMANDTELLFKDLLLEDMLENQSVSLENDPEVRVSALLINGEPVKFMKRGVETLHEIFMDGLLLSEGGPCLGWRPGPKEPYQWLTYQQVVDRTKKFGSGLFSLRAKPGTDQFIGIFSQNRVEWKITEQTCNSYSMVIVPLYNTLGPEAIRHVIIQCDLDIIVVDNSSKAVSLLEKVKSNDFKLKLIVVMDEINDDAKKLATETEVVVMRFTEVEAAGEKDLKEFVPPSPEDLHTVCYTSGTTGLPKGVMLTHANVVANVAGIHGLGHKIWSSTSGSKIKSFLLRTALSSKMGKLRNGIVTRNTIWDKLVFGKVQNMFGGRLKFSLSGAAPISSDVLNFMRCALGIPITEGYGQTEATAGIAASVPGDYFSGSVGPPCLCAKVKLADVPEKNYFAKDGKGEICVKGPSVFQGYYKDEEKTKEAVDEDGWLHTGDVGMWLPNGTLKVIDRKKNIFKLSQGEYISPEKIEQILIQCSAIAQAFIYGNSLKSSVIAIVVPDPEATVSWCDSKNFNCSYEDLCLKEEVNKLILDDINALGRKRGLKSFELPKKIHLCSEMFTVENNLLTPTLKSKRPQLQQKFQEVLDKMYENLD